MRDRIIAPRRHSRGIFRISAKGVPSYDGQVIRWRSDGNWHYRGPGGTFTAKIFPDGSIAFADQSSFGLPFDVTDAVMRRLKQDPYGAEKRRFVQATRTWRLGLRRRWRRKWVQQALRRYAATGPTCRRYAALDAGGRRRLRRLIFQRWDETEEAGDGLTLRGLLMRLVRRCGMTYPPAELRALNARRMSRQAFAPVDGPPR